MSDNRRMNLAAAAERTGLSVSTLRRWIATDRLRAVKESGRFSVTQDDLDAGVAAPERELEALVKRIVDDFPPLSPGRRAELGRLLGSADGPVPARNADRLRDSDQGRRDGSDSELRQWARQEAAKAPPFRPEQLDIIFSAFRSLALERDQDPTE